MNRYIVAFFIFSFLGWVWESIYCTICERKWANRGFLYGPICPIYGFGSLLGLFIYDLVKGGYLPTMEWWMIFILGFIVSMVLEYPTSWALEKLFKARWWDYSDVPLNINGRTSVPTSVAFGCAAILLMKVLIPLADRGISPVPEPLLDFLALVLVSIISIDTTLTISALTDFQKRVASIEEGFQNRMTDIVNQVYNIQNSFYRKVIERIAVFKLPERRKRIAKQLRENQFVELIKDYFKADVEKHMDKNLQHDTTATLERCEDAAWISYLVNERLRLNAGEKELVEAAMLHDLYLYDWRDGDDSRKANGTGHSDMENDKAVKYFSISEKEQEAIKSRMWPENITEIPKNKEALIMYLADKYCALVEKVRRDKHF